MFYNPLAAVPSPHCGFAFAIGIALAAAARRRWAKALALAWGRLLAVTVVATANHYIFDVAAGLLVSFVGYTIARVRATDAPATHRLGARSAWGARGIPIRCRRLT
jgi:membrane-associated phospholipid phosphatase